MENAERKARVRYFKANEGIEKKKVARANLRMCMYWTVEFSESSLRTLYPFTNIAWGASSVRRGCVHCMASILYASPTHRHPPQRVNPVHLILAFFVLCKPLRPGPHLSSIPTFVCTLVRFRTPSYIHIVPVKSVNGKRKEKMKIRRKHGRKGVWEEGDKESMKSRERRELLQSALKKLGNALRKVDSRSKSLLSSR